MLRQQVTTKHGDQARASFGSGAVNAVTPQDESAFKADIDNMYSMSRRGLWGILIFLVFSAVAYCFRNYTLGGILPGDVMAWLVEAPDVILVNVVFGASTLSSLIIIAGRIYNERRPSNTWTHLAFRVFFYLLYFISSSLNEYYNMVFISGLVVLALQHCNVWNFYSRGIEIKLNRFERPHPCGRGLSGK